MTTDRIPAPRPVPTQEDRMAGARNDRTFATYLDRTERDQLDARAATAEQERDEALDDRDAYREARDVLRKQLDRLQPLIDAALTWRQWYGNTNPSYASACNDLAAAIDAALGSPPPRAQEGPVMVPLAGWGGGHSRVPARRGQEPGAWMNRRALVSDALGRALTARGYDVPLPVRDRCAEAVLAAQDDRPHPGLHVTRGTGPSDLESTCPCPKEPCGAVDTRRANPDCEQHPGNRAKTMRQMHRADQCPAAREG